MNPIEILMLEDNPRDAELAMRELRREGIEFNAKRVWTEEEFLAGLRNPALDLILADYSLPSYDGVSALELARKERPKVPFIFVSGTLGEETAIDALHHGAADYVLKQKLTRLGSSVQRALRQAEEHKLIAQMAQRLTENEKRYRQLFGGIKSGVAVYEVRADGEDFVFKDFNAAAERIENVKKALLLGKSVTEIFPGIRQMGLLDVFKRVWKTGVPEHHPVSLYREGSGVSWRENYVYKLPSGELVAVYDDVTERRQSEEKVKISEERLRQALDAGQMGAWELDLVSDTSWRTLRHDQIFGYTSAPADWNYEILLQHVVPEDLDLVKRCFAQALTTDRLSLECRIARPGQEPRWIGIQGRVHRNEKGERVRLMGTVSDISERKLMEKVLRESEQRFRLLADNASDVIWTLDTSGRLSYVSPSVQRLLGYTPADVLSRGMDQMLIAASVATARKRLGEAIPKMQTDKRLRETFELQYIRKDGWPVWCEVACSGMFDSSGKFMGIVGVSRDISERKRAEEKLARLNQKNELILSSAAEGILGLDLEGNHTFVNLAAARMLGYEAEELLGRPSHSAWHHTKPDGCPSLKEECEIYATLRDGTVHRVSTEVFWRKDGTSFPVEYASTPIHEHGRLAGAVVTFADISERKRAEEATAERTRLTALQADIMQALAESDSLSEHLQHCAQAAVRHLDAAFARIWTLNEAENILELKASAGLYTHLNGGHARVPVGQFKIGLIAQERKPHLTNAVVGDPRVGDQEWARREGMVAFAGFPIMVGDRLLGVFAMFARHALSDAVLKGLDTAAGSIALGIERRLAEQAQQRLATAVEQAAEIIMITDTEGAILYVNPAFERITGYTRAEAIGQNPRLLKSGKHDAAFYKQMWDTLSRGEVWHGHFINKKKDGSIYEEDATITPTLDAAGKIVNYVAVERDVTREVAMEAQLRESQKMEAIGTLAGGVAHEINNPINGIMNYAQVIADELPADSRLQQFAANIIKETNRVSQIVRNLLSFARQNPQQRSPANLNDIIKSVLTLVQSVIRHDQITLEVDVPEGLPQMECHSQQLEQVLLNLLTNARDALNEKYPAYHEDKIIRVTARLFERDGARWIRTTVEDHANGIPAEVRDRVLDPFFTTKPAGKGTGLGLSISHGIVKDHGGVLHFETESGRGTRFHMDLPVK